jgi:hypothetical protein
MQMEQNSPAVQGPLDGEVRPVCWRREWNGDVSDEGTYVHADHEDELDNDGRWEPLYDQHALDAAVAAERERRRGLAEQLRTAAVMNDWPTFDAMLAELKA